MAIALRRGTLIRTRGERLTMLLDAPQLIAGGVVLFLLAVLAAGAPFVTAYALSGESVWRIIVSEILPHLSGLLTFTFVGGTLVALLTEFNLEFLGLAPQNNLLGTGWGTMLYTAHYEGAFAAGYWWWWGFPAVGIAVTGLALALTTIGLESVSDPRRRL